MKGQRKPASTLPVPAQSGISTGATEGPRPSTNDDKSETESEKTCVIRVGPDFQARLPELIPKEERDLNQDEKALLWWRPTKDLSDDQITKFITMAKQKFDYPAEKSLGLLLWHGHDLKKAADDLPKYSPKIESWTYEDKRLIEKAFKCYGNDFVPIKKLFPEKSMSSVMCYFFNWVARQKDPHLEELLDGIYEP